MFQVGCEKVMKRCLATLCTHQENIPKNIETKLFTTCSCPNRNVRTTL